MKTDVVVRDLNTVPQFLGRSDIGWFQNTVVGGVYRVGSVGDVSYTDVSGALRRQKFGYPEDWYHETVVYTMDGTMTMSTNGLFGPATLEIVHYKTTEEAQRGHLAMVAKYRALVAASVV